MQRAEDDKFYRLLHRRLRFRGRYDGYKESCSRRDGNLVYPWPALPSSAPTS